MTNPTSPKPSQSNSRTTAYHSEEIEHNSQELSTTQKEVQSQKRVSTKLNKTPFIAFINNIIQEAPDYIRP